MEMSNLDLLQQFVDEINSNNSSDFKVGVIKKYAHHTFIKDILFYVYNPFYQFHVTSKNCLKLWDKTPTPINNMFFTSNQEEDIINILEQLRNRIVTGHEAVHMVNSFIKNKEPQHAKLIYSIIDKDLKTRTGAKLINKAIPKLIPEFEVALAYSYGDYESKVNFQTQRWFCSRKLDGVRCITIIDDKGNPTFWSREGKQFHTLGGLEIQIRSLKLKNKVLDGEVCIVNGDKEDFTAIVSEIKRKDHTISKPKYYIFDYLELDEFNSRKSSTILSQRLKSINNIIPKQHIMLSVLEQTLITSPEQLEEEMVQVRKMGFEGLMLRLDTLYEGKRSNHMLKLKDFIDSEYYVLGTLNDHIQYINHDTGLNVEELMMAKVLIEHKGYSVSVGSGFTINERKHYYLHPEDIIGKQITVQYFKETKNKEGGLSLRFPTVKIIYKQKRDI